MGDSTSNFRVDLDKDWVMNMVVSELHVEAIYMFHHLYGNLDCLLFHYCDYDLETSAGSHLHQRAFQRI